MAGTSRYKLGLIKRDGTPYKRKPRKPEYARFGLIDNKGNVKRIIEDIPLNEKNALYLGNLLQENKTLKDFDPALKEARKEKKQLQKKQKPYELVLVGQNLSLIHI